MNDIKLFILEANYWEHYKYAKELSLILPINDSKRISIERALNNMLIDIHKLKGIRYPPNQRSEPISRLNAKVYLT